MKGECMMFELKMLENVVSIMVLTVIILMISLWSEYKGVKILAVVMGCWQSLESVNLTRKYLKRLEEELEKRPE